MTPKERAHFIRNSPTYRHSTVPGIEQAYDLAKYAGRLEYQLWWSNFAAIVAITLAVLSPLIYN